MKLLQAVGHSISHVLKGRALSGALVMAGFLVVMAPAASGQVVFNEVRYKNTDGSTTNQVVELKNTSGSPLSVGGWIFCHQFIYNSVLPGGTTIPAGGYLLVHFNQGGSNSATDIFFPGDELATVTDLGLYINNSFGTPSSMKAFIQFGGHPGSGRESVADAAGLWTTGAFIQPVANGHSIELCNGSPAQVTSFVEQSTPTLGLENGCGVAVTSTSWGTLKSIFR